MPATKRQTPDIFTRHNDYRHEITVRALERTDENAEMLIEGRAVVFGEKTKLFTMGGVSYYEIIHRDAFNLADMSDVFVKYDHSDGVMVVARSKNGSLKIDIRDDGVWVTIRLANTTAGRDLYELVRTGVIDKMSFGFTIEEESYNESEHTWTILKIKKLWEVSAVPFPAYEATTLYARRAGEVESRLAEVESFRRRAKLLYIQNKNSI